MKAGKRTNSGRTLETGINPWVLGFAFCNRRISEWFGGSNDGVMGSVR